MTQEASFELLELAEAKSGKHSSSRPNLAWKWLDKLEANV
jgi:hypothetical protein